MNQIKHRDYTIGTKKILKLTVDNFQATNELYNLIQNYTGILPQSPV